MGFSLGLAYWSMHQTTSWVFQVISKAGMSQGEHLIEEIQNPCGNCGVTFPGKFCSNCGRKRRPTLTWRFLGETTVNALFSLEAPIWRTLRATLRDSGKASHDYISGTGKPLVGPVPFYLVAALLGAFASAQGPLMADSDLQLEALEVRTPEVHESESFATASLDELPPGMEFTFFWAFEGDAEGGQESVSVGADGTATVAISLPEGRTLQWVQLDGAPNDPDDTRLLSIPWSKGDKFTYEDLVKLEQSPQLSLLLFVPIMALLFWAFSFSKRRPLLECVVFSAYTGGILGFIYLPFSLLYGPYSSPNAALGLYLIALLWICCRGGSTFLGMRLVGCLWRTLLAISVLTILSTFVFLGMEWDWVMADL